MVNMLRALLLLPLAAIPAFGQQQVLIQPDCPVGGAGFQFPLASGGGQTSITIDNRQSGCSDWGVSYNQIGAGALSVELDSAPNVNNAPGTWVTFAGGTIISGANPSTTTPQGFIHVTGYQPFVRVLENSLSANIVGFVFGCRVPGCSQNTTSGTPTTVAGCVVVGMSIASCNPFAIAIEDNSGNAQFVADAARAGDGNNGNQTASFSQNIFNGATFDRLFWSTNRVQVTVSAGTAQRLVAQVANQITRGTHFSAAWNTATTFSLVQGTTTTTPCDTGQTVLAGPYQNITGIALDFTPYSALRNTAVNLDTCAIWGASVTAGGVFIYAQY